MVTDSQRDPSPTVEVAGVAHGGHGIARLDGQVCFVAYGLPGDKLKIRIERASRGVIWASIAEIVEPSPDRIEPPCPVFGECGGCTWLHFRYPAQAEWKQRIVQDCFERIGRIRMSLAWAESHDLRLGYRTRAEFHCDGKRWGFFAQASHRVVDIDACPLCHPALNAALARLRTIRLKGSADVVVNPETGEAMVWLRKPDSQILSLFPQADWPGKKGARCSFLFDGAPIVNGAFTQASLLLNRLLVRTVREMIGDASSLLDLYCGNGNFSLGLARANRVLGLDHNEDAITAAARMSLGEFRVSGEEEFTEALRREEWDAILLDPPRTGAKTIIQALAACPTRAIIYVSCDPATLARDLGYLTSNDWRVARATVVDMFPNTHHIETVCQMERA